MESVKIILLCIVSAVIYGNVHDQFTARVCVEYFTIGHPPIFNTESPTLLAIGWGTIATWWAGLFVGVLLAFASRLGSWPKYHATNLIQPIAGLLVVMAIASLAAGVTGYFTASAGGVWLVEPLRSEVPESKHTAFLADLWAHLAAYAFGFLGGIAICGWVLFKRWQLAGKVPIDIRLKVSQFAMLQTSRRKQSYFLLIMAGIAGLFWSFGSEIQLVIMHFVAPPLFALLVAFLFRSFSWKQQLLALLTLLVVSEFVRLLMYCIMANGWRYIFSQGETQIVILLSFIVQFTIAWFVWLVSRMLIRLYRARNYDLPA